MVSSTYRRELMNSSHDCKPMAASEAVRLCESGCAHKIRHATRREAKLHAKRLARTTDRGAGVYRCPVCGCWHVTSRKNGR